MNETTKKVITGIIVFVIFVVCVSLIVIGQKNVGLPWLCMMLLGLAGLVFLLWLYNRKYK